MKGVKMTKQNMIAKTAQKSGVTQADSKVLLDATFNVLIDYLSVKKSVSIPHFGTFDVHVRKGHRFFNIFRSKVMRTPQKYAISFHPSKEYKEKVQEGLLL